MAEGSCLTEISGDKEKEAMLRKGESGQMGQSGGYEVRMTRQKKQTKQEVTQIEDR